MHHLFFFFFFLVPRPSIRNLLNVHPPEAKISTAGRPSSASSQHLLPPNNQLSSSSTPGTHPPPRSPSSCCRPHASGPGTSRRPASAASASPVTASHVTHSGTPYLGLVTRGKNKQTTQSLPKKKPPNHYPRGGGVGHSKFHEKQGGNMR